MNRTPASVLDDIEDIMFDIREMNATLESKFLDDLEDTLYLCEKYLNELIDIKEENDQE